MVRAEVLSKAVAALIALALTLGANAPPARATTVHALSLAEKTHRAEAIVLAIVESVEPRAKGPEGLIWSRVRLRVLERFAGPTTAGAPFELWRAGGTVAGITEWLPGLHRYRVGDEVLLFAEASPRGWVSVGVGIGTYSIERGPGCALGNPECGMAHFAPRVAELRPDGSVAEAEPSVEPWPDLRARLRALVTPGPDAASTPELGQDMGEAPVTPNADPDPRGPPGMTRPDG